MLLANKIPELLHQSAVVLIFVAGEPEMRAVEHALTLRTDIVTDILLLAGCVDPDQRNSAINKITEQACAPGCKNIAVVATSWAEDGWSPHINGIIDSNEQTTVDANGFLNLGPGDECSQTQRLGHGLRFNHLVYALIQDGGTEASTAERTPPYEDLLKIETAAFGLSYEGTIAAIGPRSASVREDIMRDLVNLGVLHVPNDDVCCLASAGHEALDGAIHVRANVLLVAARSLGIEPYERCSEWF